MNLHLLLIGGGALPAQPFQIFPRFGGIPIGFFGSFDLEFLLPRVVAVLLALTVHELAHGWIAFKLGDPTAKLAGRISLNPLVHLDPLGTIALFLVGFGWAKPVPVNPGNFRSPLRDNALVALAGPMSNFASAVVFGLIFRSLISMQIDSPIMDGARITLFFIVALSLGLGLFNLIPIPPLDGSHILEALLPPNARHTYYSIRNYAPIALLILIFALPGALGVIIGAPREFLFSLITGFKIGP